MNGDLFDYMESMRNILSYSCEVTTLEEVFIRVASGDDENDIHHKKADKKLLLMIWN